MLDPVVVQDDEPGDMLFEQQETKARAAARPGVLRGDVTVTLHTIQAVLLFEGRRPSDDKPGIPGLYRFAHQLNRLAEGSSAGDPYADHCLVRIEDSLDELEHHLGREKTKLADEMAALDGLTIVTGQSVEPRVETLKLRAPHAFRAARVIVLMDGVIKRLLTLEHVGKVGRRERNQRVGRLMRLARRPLYLAESYRIANITRQDVLDDSDRFREAAQSRVELPMAVVDQSLMPRFPLRPRRARSEAVDDSASELAQG